MFLAPTGKVQQTGVLTVDQTGMVVPPDLSDMKSVSASYATVVAIRHDNSIAV
jgi:hypothetical protein